MKELEEELQRQAERGEFNPDSPDSLAYQKVFAVLNTEPFKPSPRLADEVIRRVSSRRKNISPDFWWMMGGIFVLVAAAIVLMAMSNIRPEFGLPAVYSIHLTWLFPAALLLILFQFLDHKIIRTKITV